jgi:hypothetical protein
LSISYDYSTYLSALFFHIISLFNLLFFHIFHIFSLFKPFCPIFSSPGPKIHVNYCHYLASAVCRLLSVVCRLYTFHISSFFSETTGPIETKLSRNDPCMVLCKVTLFRSSRIFNMAGRANNML